MQRTYNFSSKCNGNAGNHYTLKLIVTIGDSDDATLQTPIGLKLTRTDDGYGGNYGYNNPTTLKINGTSMATATPVSHHDTMTTQTLIEKTGIIYHASDGNVDHITIGSNTVNNIEDNSFTALGMFTSSSPMLSGGSTSGNVLIDAIIVSPNEITNVSTFVLGHNNPTITIEKADETFTTSLYYQPDAHTPSSLELIVDKISDTSYEWILSSAYIAQLKQLYPNSTEGSIKVVAYTYNGNILRDGSSSFTQIFTIPKPNIITSISNFTLEITNPIITIDKTSSLFTTTLTYEIGEGENKLTGTIVTKTNANSYEWGIDSTLIESINSLYPTGNQGILKVIATTYNGNILIDGSTNYTKTFTIPRENGIEDVTSFVLGETNPTITIKKGNSNYTTTIYRASFNDEEGIMIPIVEKTSATSYEWILSDNDIKKFLENTYSNEWSWWLFSKTYDGNTQIGDYGEYEIKFTVSDIYKPVVNDVTLIELNDKVSSLTDKIVRYQSKLNAIITATAGKDRTINNYFVTYGTKLANEKASSTNSMVLENEDIIYIEGEPVLFKNLMDYYYTFPDGVTNVTTYTAEVRDERFFYSDKFEITRGFVPYINLNLENYTIERISSTSDYIRIKARGTFFDSDELGKQNELYVSYKYREKGTNEWRNGRTNVRRGYEVTYSGGRYNLDFQLNESFAYGKSWEFVIYIADLLVDLQIDYELKADIETFINRYESGRSTGYGLIAENEDGNHIVLTDSSDFAIEYLDGFYSLSASLPTVKIGTRDGEKLSARTVNKRNVGIYLYIKKNVSQNRISLYKIFKAKGKVKLSYYSKNRQVTIEGYVEDINITPHQQLTQAQIVILCPNPFLKNINDIIFDLNKSKGNLYFPFYVTDRKKSLGYNLETTARVIPNNGDYETGMIISMKAISNTTNPFVFDSYNNFFQVGTLTNPFSMSAGDELIIDTDKKTVKLISNTVETNIFNYIAPNSKWLKLQVGENIIDYSNSNTALMEVVITYNYKYEGV